MRFGYRPPRSLLGAAPARCGLLWSSMSLHRGWYTGPGFPEGIINYSFSLRGTHFRFCLECPTIYLCLHFAFQEHMIASLCTAGQLRNVNPSEAPSAISYDPEFES